MTKGKKSAKFEEEWKFRMTIYKIKELSKQHASMQRYRSKFKIIFTWDSSKLRLSLAWMLIWLQKTTLAVNIPNSNGIGFVYGTAICKFIALIIFSSINNYTTFCRPGSSNPKL